MSSGGHRDVSPELEHLLTDRLQELGNACPNLLLQLLGWTPGRTRARMGSQVASAEARWGTRQHHVPCVNVGGPACTITQRQCCCGSWFRIEELLLKPGQLQDPCTALSWPRNGEHDDICVHVHGLQKMFHDETFIIMISSIVAIWYSKAS
jgi:hypothetical protein